MRDKIKEGNSLLTVRVISHRTSSCENLQEHVFHRSKDILLNSWLGKSLDGIVQTYSLDVAINENRA